MCNTVDDKMNRHSGQKDDQKMRRCKKEKKKKGRIKAVEAKCAGFTSELTWTASSPSLYINLSQEKSQE